MTRLRRGTEQSNWTGLVANAQLWSNVVFVCVSVRARNSESEHEQRIEHDRVESQSSKSGPFHIGTKEAFDRASPALSGLNLGMEAHVEGRIIFLVRLGCVAAFLNVSLRPGLPFHSMRILKDFSHTFGKCQRLETLILIRI